MWHVAAYHEEDYAHCDNIQQTNLTCYVRAIWKNWICEKLEACFKLPVPKDAKDFYCKIF